MNHYASRDDEFDTTDMMCPGCDQVNPDMEWVDFGIGSYEYWGAPGCDVQECYVTKCCETDPVEYIGQDQIEEPNPNYVYESEVS